MGINDYLKEHNLRPADLARGVGAVHCVARRWCRGEVFPNREYMQKIFAFTGGAVTPNDFYNINKKELNHEQTQI